MALQLAVDTSSSIGELALFEDQTIIDYVSWEKERSHSEVITGAFENLIQKNSLKKKDISHVYCVNGPGSFTGLRVGVNFAKTLAYSFGLKMTAINRLQLQATSMNLDHSSSILSTLDAQKNSVFCSLFKFENNKFEVQFENQVLTIDAMTDVITEKTFVCGAGLNNYKSFLTPALVDRLVFSNSKQQSDLKNIFTPPVKAHNKKEVSWFEFQPLYIKASAPEEKLNPTVFKN